MLESLAGTDFGCGLENVTRAPTEIGVSWLRNWVRFQFCVNYPFKKKKKKSQVGFRPIAFPWQHIQTLPTFLTFRLVHYLSFPIRLSRCPPAWHRGCVQHLTCWGDTCPAQTPQNKFATLFPFTAHLAQSMFWHSVVVTLGELFSNAQRRGEAHSRAVSWGSQPNSMLQYFLQAPFLKWPPQHCGKPATVAQCTVHANSKGRPGTFWDLSSSFWKLASSLGSDANNISAPWCSSAMQIHKMPFVFGSAFYSGHRLIKFWLLESVGRVSVCCRLPQQPQRLRGRVGVLFAISQAELAGGGNLKGLISPS